MKYTQIPANTFEELQLNAGILLSEFNPTDGSVSNENILGATSGGVSFTDVPEYSDFGEDIDNCPKNVQYIYRSFSVLQYHSILFILYILCIEYFSILFNAV